MREAIRLSDEMNARREVWRMGWTLAGLEAEPAHLETAECLREKARAVITVMSEHIGAPELRVVFLAREDVRAVLHEYAPV